MRRALAAALALLIGCGGQHERPTLVAGITPQVDLAAERAALVRQGALGELGLFELMWSGDRAAAEAALGKALKARPDDARALLGAALADQDALRIAPARERYLRIIELAAAGDPDAAAMAGYAITELGQLMGEAPGDAELAARVERLLGRGLGPDLTWDLGGVAVDLAKARGDLAAAVATTQARGCVRAMEVRGPYGTVPLLDLAEDADLAIAAKVKSVARPVQATLCGMGIGPHSGQAGVLHASATIDYRGSVLLVIDDDSRSPYVLELGGQVVYRHLARDRFLARRIALPVELAGPTTLRLRIATRGAAASFRVGLVDPRTGRLPVGLTTRPGDAGSAKARAKVGQPAPFGAAPQALAAIRARFPLPRLAPLAALLTVHGELRSGQSDGDTMSDLDRVLAGPARFAAAHYLAAQRDLERAGVVGWTSARDAARDQLTHLLAASPRSVRGLLSLAQMDLEDENARQALERLDRAIELEPALAGLHLERARALRDRGFGREADAAVLEAERLYPGGCPVEKALTALYADHRDAAAQLAHAQAVIRCDPFDALLLAALRRRADFAGARVELARLTEAGLNEDALAVERAELALVEGDAAGAARDLGAAVARKPTDVGRRLSWVDALLASGQRAKALEAIDAGLAEAPENQQLWQAREVLGEGGPMDAYRLDGFDVIRDYLKSGRSYGAPAVVLLDRTVVKIFPTGARLTLTHNVIQVLAKEGLEQWGEVRIPAGARVIKLRTVKPDFTTREPEDIANKDTVSAPDLQIGDFVEYEWIEADAPLGAFSGGFVGDRFYFGTFDAPLDRTEMDIVTPAGPLAIDVRYDVRGNAPKPVTTTVNGETHVMFADHGRPQLVGEPASVPNVEVIASTRPYARITWEGWRRMLRQQTWAAARADHSVRARAAAIVRAAKAKTPRQQAAALYAWVVENIEGGGGLGSEPAEVLAERQGSRVVLLAALLAAQGIDSEIWLGRPRQAGDDPPLLPEVDEASEAVLRIALPEGALFTELRFKRAPFGFIPPALRGAAALRLGSLTKLPSEGQELWGQLPDGEAKDDRREIRLEVSFGAGGVPEVSAVETLRGVPALEWREGLDQIPPKEVERQFEQRVLGFHFPGAELKKLRIEGRKDSAAPLVLRYSFAAPSLLRRGRTGGLAFTMGLYGAALGKAYLGVGTRTRALIADDLALEDVEAKVTLPAGVIIHGAPPQPVEIAGKYGHFTQSLTPGAGGFTLKQTLRMPLRRVPVAEYDAFSRFVRAVDSAQDREVGLVSGREVGLTKGK